MGVSLAMGWRYLLFENWRVDPTLIDAHLPESLEVDTYDGNAWLSIVPFVNVALRPNGFPSWAGASLPELNVRTYVRYENIPGVYFFSLDAQGIISVLGARILHRLPYYYARISLDTSDDGIRFSSRRRHPGARPAQYRAWYRPKGQPFAATEDPLTEFLFERYRLYTEDMDGMIRYTAVEHDPWIVRDVDTEVRAQSMLRASGFERPKGEPIYYYSPGLNVRATPSISVSDR